VAGETAGRTGPGTVVLDIGGGTGALIVRAPAELAGREIHVSPAHPPGAARTHAVVRERLLGAATCHAAVYAPLPAGDYTVWHADGSPAGSGSGPNGGCATHTLSAGASRGHPCG
jgi:hypothetical protein